MRECLRVTIAAVLRVKVNTTATAAIEGRGLTFALHD
jgi:hypothetical protein